MVKKKGPIRARPARVGWIDWFSNYIYSTLANYQPSAGQPGGKKKEVFGKGCAGGGMDLPVSLEFTVFSIR